MAGVAHFSTGHEHSIHYQVCCFHLFGVFLASKGSNYSELIPLKPVLGGVPSVANFITGHGLAQLNRVCCFHFLGICLASKGSNYSELIFMNKF